MPAKTKKVKTSKKSSKEKKNILIFCSHSDDQILGVGGSIDYYSNKGYNVYSYIFSYGEGSHPHLQEKVITKIRVNEAKKADKIVNGSGVHFFGVKDGNFESDMKKKNIKNTLKKIIKDKKPVKIFTHSIDDAHPDHRETNKIVLDANDDIKFYVPIYVFDLWNPLSFQYRNNPRLAIDIKRSFNKKIKALECFESQTITMILLLWTVYLRAFIWGIRHRIGLAEVFYKIR